MADPAASLAHAKQLHALFIKTETQTHAASTTTTSSNSSFSPSRELTSIPSISASFSPAAANSIVRAYARSQRPDHALRFFLGLHERHCCRLLHAALLPSLLGTCARLRAASSEGRQLHALAHKTGIIAHPRVRNSLVHMYCCCGLMTQGRKLFDRMPLRDVVSWTCIINGAVEADSPVEALLLFDSMEGEGVLPNEATVVSVLRACAEAGALSVGHRVHGIAEERRLDGNPKVATSLIDMYAKCDCIIRAENIFEGMKTKDIFSWTAMIYGLANHGRWEDALDLFHQMVDTGVMPNERTVTAVLCACRSAGLVAQGYRIYNYMHRYGLRPRIQHYGCMVDLLARAGHLDGAEGFLQRIPFESGSILWRRLIWASKLHGDLDRAQRLLNDWQQLSMTSHDSGSFALMANVSASVIKWQKKAENPELMDNKKISKLPGFSWIEVKGIIHEFRDGYCGHPEAKRIYQKSEEITEKLRSEGYNSKVSDILLDMDEEEVSQLQHQSEKLAVAFGLISTRPGDKILIVKNLRTCEDCHTVMKTISRVYNREITIKDRIRFHHFVNGFCSCRDHW